MTASPPADPALHGLRDTMKKTNATAPRSESLPTFLDEPAQPMATAESPVDEAAPTTGTETSAEAPADATPPSSADEPTAATDTAPAPTPTHRARRATTKPPRGGTLSTVLGAAALLTAVALPFAPALAGKLTPLGLDAGLLALSGTVLLAAGAGARRTAHLQQKLDDERNARADQLDALQHEVRELAGTTTDAPEQTENQRHLLLAVQRQDDKLNNLTKALKIYGQPMMEIANQGTELAGGVAAVKTLVEGGADSTRQALSRMETQLRQQQTTAKQETGEIHQGLLKLATKLDTLGSRSDALQPVLQKLSQLEVSIAAIAQRLEDNEVRKSLLRLEESSAKEHDTLQQLLRADAVRSATSELQSQFERAARGLADGLQQLRTDELGGLDHVVREIQREVTGVATAVAQIQASVKGGARVATTPSNTAAPATTASPTPTTSPSPVATANAATNAATPTANPTGGQAAAADGGAYATGTRATAGKNVLGAIARLKQMKG